MQSSPSIVAVAARTPVGLCAEGTAAAIRAGISRIGAHPFMVDADGDPLSCGRDDALDPACFGINRLAALLESALSELHDKLDGVVPDRVSIPVALAVAEARPGFEPGSEAALVRELVRRAPTRTRALQLRVAGRGHAGGLAALESATKMLAGGQHELCIVAGVDSYLHADTLDWLDADLRLARATARGGFPPGEAAAAVVLVSERLRRDLRLASLASVAAVACAHEPRDETAAEGLQGEGLTRALCDAARGRDPSAPHIGQLYCDINDERARSTDLGFALLRCGGLFRDGTDYRTPIGSIGDVGAATGPLNCMLAATAWHRGYATETNTMVSGASWGGLRGAALLEKRN